MALPLFSFQASAAHVMAKRERYGEHDEMGVGKTATTVGAINLILAERGVIICPAMLRANWIKELKMFSTYDLRAVKAKSLHDWIAWSRRRFDVLVCSYEHATKWAQHFIKHGEYIDFIAMDEAHYLKNVNSQRTRAVLGHEGGGQGSIVQYASHAWHVTGTPMANDPMDCYAFLRFVNAVDLTQDKFTEAFFHKRMTAYGFRHTVKDEMLHTLQQMLRANSIRRTHEEVGMFLPKIWMTETVIDGDTQEIYDAMRDYPFLEQQIIEAIEAQDMTMLNAAHIATVRRLVGKAKAAAYAPMLKMELDAGSGKRVAFFTHTEPLLYVKNFLEKYGYRVVTVYGDTPEGKRQEAVRLFMEDPGMTVFLGNMRVAGVGLTLTSASQIDVVESDWTPANNAQAIKRVHRYGQTNEVHARFITLADSIDEAVNKTVADKTAAIARIEGFTMNAAVL